MRQTEQTNVSQNAPLTTSPTPARTEVCFTLIKALSILELC